MPVAVTVEQMPLLQRRLSPLQLAKVLIGIYEMMDQLSRAEQGEVVEDLGGRYPR
jgi:hypothetical protein